MLLVTVELGFVGVLLEMSIERRDSHRSSLERVDGVAAGHRARGNSHVGQFLIGHVIQPMVVFEVFLELCVGGHFEPATCALDRGFVDFGAALAASSLNGGVGRGGRGVGRGGLNLRGCALWRFSGGGEAGRPSLDDLIQGSDQIRCRFGCALFQPKVPSSLRGRRLRRPHRREGGLARRFLLAWRLVRRPQVGGARRQETDGRHLEEKTRSRAETRLSVSCRAPCLREWRGADGDAGVVQMCDQ